MGGRPGVGRQHSTAEQDFLHLLSVTHHHRGNEHDNLLKCVVINVDPESCISKTISYG